VVDARSARWRAAATTTGRDALTELPARLNRSDFSWSGRGFAIGPVWPLARSSVRDEKVEAFARSRERARVARGPTVLSARNCSESRVTVHHGRDEPAARRAHEPLTSKDPEMRARSVTTSPGWALPDLLNRRRGPRALRVAPRASCSARFRRARLRARGVAAPGGRSREPVAASFGVLRAFSEGPCVCCAAPFLLRARHAALPELGYDRVWLADSPALYGDVWTRWPRPHTRAGSGSAPAC
jgi:hypothetical protein